MSLDDKLYKTWNFAAMYSAGPKIRMKILDEKRNMKYAVLVAGEYFRDGPMDNLRVVVMKREQAENLAKILLASGEETDIEVVEYE